MPTTDKKDPFTNFKFLVEIDGIPDSAFSRVILPECRIEPIEYREGIELRINKKLLGNPSIGQLVLERGITSSTALSDWYKTALTAHQNARRNIAITLLDEKHDVVCRWEIAGAIPAKYNVAPLNAGANDVLIESMELACESFQRVQ